MLDQFLDHTDEPTRICFTISANYPNNLDWALTGGTRKGQNQKSLRRLWEGIIICRHEDHGLGISQNQRLGINGSEPAAFANIVCDEGSPHGRSVGISISPEQLLDQ